MEDSLGATKRKPGRAFDDMSSLGITVDEIRRRLRRRVGKAANFRPKSGEGKSTKISLYDIALLARLDKDDLYKFSLGKFRFGLIKMTRLLAMMNQIDAGLVTKSQHGVYHFHDEPVAEPVKEMRISLGTGKIMQGIKVAKVEKMPSFNKVFGG